MRILEQALWIIISCAFIICAVAISAPAQDNNPISPFARPDFDNSICFQKCHNPETIAAADMPENLWRNLIEKSGHNIFSEIPWKSSEQKEQILRYLLSQARKAEPESEGIGSWSSPIK